MTTNSEEKEWFYTPENGPNNVPMFAGRTQNSSMVNAEPLILAVRLNENVTHLMALVSTREIME